MAMSTSPTLQTKYSPLVYFGDTSPNGEGFVWCIFVGGVDGDIVIGMHLRLFGDERWAGLCRGSNSKLRLSVAPQAIFLRSLVSFLGYLSRKYYQEGVAYNFSKFRRQMVTTVLINGGFPREYLESARIMAASVLLADCAASVWDLKLSTSCA